MKRIIIVMLLGLVGYSAVSQDNGKLFNQALLNIDDGGWDGAIELLNRLISQNDTNANIYFKLGYCYLNKRDLKNSIFYLEKACRNIDVNQESDNYKIKTAPIEAYYYLAQAYHLNSQFEKSLKILDKLKTYVTDPDSQFLREINLLQSYDINAINLTKHPVLLQVQNLGRNINSIFDDHSPVFNAAEDLLIFTSRRDGSKGNQLLSDYQFDEDIYVSHKDSTTGEWQPAINIGDSINTAEHDASIGLSANGKMLLIYREDPANLGSIYFSNFKNGKWETPQPFPKPINSKDRETHATISSDGNTIYFTSDRPDGYGGLDIYRIKKLPNGEWSWPLNLGPTINTPYDEDGPYIFNDDKTLYFSSKGNRSMGGFDIFYSVYNSDSNTWETPKNIGYPVNSVEDDIYYLPTKDGARAYYSSDQFGTIGREDIYMLTFPDKIDKNIAILSGYVFSDLGTIPKGVMLSVTDDENPDIQGSYAPNTHTGRYVLILQAGHSYRMVASANGYPSEKIAFTVDKPTKEEVVSLDTIILDSPDTSFFINFATNSLAISEEAKSTLKETYKYFENHRDLDVNIFASINPISDYNKKRKAILQRLLTGLGIPKKQIFIDAKETKPVKVIILDNDYTITEEQNTVKDEGIVLTTIYFGFNKWTTSYYNNYLDKLAVYMKKNPETLILVKGYTDNVGNNKYNNRLSMKRAKFVKNYLVEQGVNPMQIRVKGFGKSNFVASNASEEGSSYNRRVEIKVIKSGTTPIKIEEPEIPAEYKIKK